MKAPLIHVASMIFNEPLAILPKKLDAILHALGPRLQLDEHALKLLQADATYAPTMLQNMSSVTLPANFSGTISGNGDIPAITPGSVLVVKGSSFDDDEDDDKPYQLMQGGIAVIPVRGTLMKRGSWLSAASGLSTYQGVQKATAAALSDPMVKAVMFDINSPGGTTHGCFELSDALYGMRGDKPMWACANDLAASAAYAIGSAADRVLLTRTAGVGSIGVFALHCDMSNADDQMGVKYTYIFAGDRKVDGNPHEPLSKSAKSDIQAEVDREYAMFVQAVARNRASAGATPKNIKETEAAVFFGDNAKGLLADDVATLDEAMEALAAKVNGAKVITSGKLASTPEPADNAGDPEKAEEPATATSKEENDMATAPTAEDLKKRATAAEAEAQAAAEIAAEARAAARAAEPDDDEDDDEPGKKKKEDTDDDEAKKGKKAKAVAEMPRKANAAAVTISNLCKIAGTPELAADYIAEGKTVDDVIAALSERRSKASAEASVNSYVTGQGGNKGGAMSVDAAIEQANVMSANSGGTLSPSKCLEQLMRRNPAIYSGYLEEKGTVAMQAQFTGGGRALEEFVYGKQTRYMLGLGLSSTIDAVPNRRAM